MKTTSLLAVTLSIATLGTLAPLSAQAQETTPNPATPTASSSSSSMPGMDQQNGTTKDSKKPRVETSSSGKPTIVVPLGASGTDLYNVSWIYRNLDAREVRRFQTQGFDDGTIKSAANVAMRTGLDLDFILRMFRESGYSLTQVASMYGLATNVINRDIPGYGADTVAIQVPPTRTTSTYGSGSESTPVTAAITEVNATGTASSAVLPASQGTVVDVAMADPQFTNLVTLIKVAGLADTLKGSGPYTILAPTNAAFAKLPTGTLDYLLKPENQATLRAILSYHVLPGRVMAADVMGMTNPSTPRTLEGSTLNVKTSAPVMVNNANVTQTDIAASNGVIHAIDTILVPSSVTLPGAATSTPAPTSPDTTPATPAPPTNP